jgi:hypothetical protein
MIDPLEERMLLTVSIGNSSDQTVNQLLGSQTTGTTSNPNLSYTGTTGTQAVATDDNGDFVVAWTGYDPLINPETGLQVRDSISGRLKTEANIYARYYTDEVQRITLPAQMLNTGTQLPAFSLVYGGNAVQKISITQTNTTGTSTSGTAQGVFSLGFDLNGDGLIDPVTETTRPIQFNETAYNSTDPTKNPANLMQNALRALGGPLADLTVTALDSHEYEVDFGDASQGQPMNMIAAMNPAWTSGNLPSVTVSMVRQPINIGVTTTGAPRIYVSPTDPLQTALSIQTAFSAANWTANGMDPVTVTVTPVDNSLFTFDITFVGNSGKTDQPQLVFGQMADSTGTSLSVLHITNPAVPTIDSLNVLNIKTLKEPSAEFRVNPPEPQDPYSSLPTQYDQLDPAVAMDADGDFVITWTSVVPDSVNQGSQTDVFARRYSPSALMSKPNMVISSHTLSVPESNNGTFTVALDRQPLSNITVTISKEVGGDADLYTTPNPTPITLTFTPSNWNQAQTVTIHAAPDADNTNGTANFDVSIPDYATQVVSATEIDSKSLIVSSNNVSVPEGAYNTFTVKLATAPTSDVTVNVAALAGGDVDLTVDSSTTTLKFTIADPNAADYWSKPHSVTVNDAEDADTTNGTAVISLTPDIASGYGSQTVNLTEVDKDLSSIMLSAETLSVVEGRSNSFTVALSAAPTGQVEVDILKRADSTSDITASPTRLYFNALNWNIARTVTLNAPLDTTVNNGTAYFYVYAPNNPEYVYQTVTANEIGVGQFVISQNTLMVPEGGSNTFTVALAGQPPSNVTVSITKQAGGDPDLTASPTTFTLGPGNWNAPQMVTINANDDPDAINGTAVFYVIAPGYINQAIAVSEADTTAPPALIITPTPALATDPVVVAVTEGGINTITVALPVAPPVDVTMTITQEAGGDTDLTATSTALTFTTANPAAADYWSKPHTITFHAAADTDSINGAAVFYLDVPGYAAQKIFVGEVDRTPSTYFTIGYTPTTASIVVVPEGGTNTFTVRLAANPAADTTVNITALAGSDPDLAINPTTLTFTADIPATTGPPPTLLIRGTWSIPQTITASAVADADTADGIAYFDVTAAGLTTQTVTLIENDNTPMNLVVSSNTVFVPEGGNNTFTVALSAAPVANVTVTIGSQTQANGGDTDLTALPPTTLIFTPNNWNVAQTVTIRDAQDADNTDGTRYFYVSALSAGLTTQVVTAMELDSNVPNVTISNTQATYTFVQNVSVLEGDTTGHKFYVSLPSIPTYNVTVNINKQAGGDPAIKVNNANNTTLTFTPLNWNTPQAVTFTSIADSDAINGIANFYISAIGYSVQTVAVTQIDINASPVVITANTVWVPEGGFKLVPIKLAYQPISNVTVTVSTESLPVPDGDLSATPTTFTFTSANWYIPQTVVLYDAKDADSVDGTAVFDLTASTPTSEGTTTPVTTFPWTTSTLTANEVDNDANTLITSTDLVQVLEGSTSTFTVVLPQGLDVNGDGKIDKNDVYTVTIARQAGGDADLRAIPTTLTFDGTNYNKPQYVKILDNSDPQTAYTTNGSSQFLISSTGYVSTIVTATEINHITPKTTNDTTDNIPVQGVRPLGNAFRVNTYTTNKQYEASVSMDDAGNFVVSWTDEGQFTSFFNNIQAQRFDRDGNRVGSQFQVNSEITAPEFNSYVSMSGDGHFLITWTEERSAAIPDEVMAKVYNQNGTIIANQFDVALGFASSAAWDSGNNYIITFDRVNWATPPVADDNLDVDRPAIATLVQSTGVYQIRYSIITDATGAVTSGNTVTLPIFRVNSAWSDPTNPASAGYFTSWPYYQGNNQVAMDADGDITTVYDGYGSEMSYTLNLDYTINLDLWTAQQSGLSNTDVSLLQTFYPYEYQNLRAGSKATDAELSDLNNAWQLYYYDYYNTSLKIDNSVNGTLYEPNGYTRGEPNGVQFSEFDAFRVVNADGSITMNYDTGGVHRDVVANSLMDGHDQQYIIGIDPTATGGGFTIRVSNSYTATPGYTDVQITPAYLPNGGPVNVVATTTTIQDALNGVTDRLGGTPSVLVRLITANEITSRTGTYWDLANYGLPTTNYQYYEITLDNQAHNQTAISLASVAPFSMTRAGGAALSPQLTVETAADLGTLQEYASVGMQPSGNFVVVWTQSDQYSNGASQNTTDYNRNQTLGELLGTTVHYRTYTESTDTAGPKVTDFILTDGTRLGNNSQINSSVSCMIVTFDEPMMITGTHSVTNTSNWALMLNGVAINGGIYKILYGLNESFELGLSTVAPNKYEAVLYFDANGASSGTPALGSGSYKIVALNSLRDADGNPLGRTGYVINGANETIDFTVSEPYRNETLVNTTTAGVQSTTASQRAVASDGKGDYVAAWISEGSGVYARMYDPSGNAKSSEMLVSSDPYAADLAVAMDGDGDFVVTWSSDKNNPSDMGTSWDVFAVCYNALGTVKRGEFRVNTKTDNIQRNSSVAMDASGDFIIVWQSFDQDGSGYGIYAQRYSPAGDRLGGLNEAQLITLVGNPTGAFALHWEGDSSPLNDTSSNITISGTANDALAAKIQAAMQYMGASVEVTVLTASTILVTFVGDYGDMYVPQITLDHYDLSGTAGAAIKITTQVNGVSSEIQVNDTTANDQMDPSIAASDNGNFVISWTGYGQDGDSAWQSNIYCKQLVSNTYYESSSKSLTTTKSQLDSQVTNKVVTTDNPANHVVTPGTGADGIVSVLTDDYEEGSGVLLSDRYHVITAAHVVCYQGTNQLVTNDVYVTFNLATGNVTIKAKMVTINPNYTGDSMRSPDIAIITLSEAAPAGVTGYDIYTGSENSIIGQIFEFYGYGLSGTGPTGDTLGYGTKREGENKYEATANEVNPTYSSNILVYDFDNGLAANDALGVYLGINDLGLGDLEANSASGDSGGGCFVNGKIVAIVTAGDGFPDVTTDVDTTTDSSFGEISYDTSVSAYADWIDAVTSSGSGPEILVNQTTTNSQKWSDVALDADGDFTVTWTSYGQDGGGNGYGAGVNGENGVYARRFSSDGSAASNEFLVNTATANNQQHSQIAMDAAGDFAITWESFQDRPSTSTGLDDSANSYGIYAQRYARTSLIGVDTSLGLNGKIGTEYRVNTTTDGDQRYPSVAMDANGDFVVVWSGYGQADDTGVFMQLYKQTKDTTGPFVTEIDNLSSTTSKLEQVYNNATFTGNVTTIVVTFDEALCTTGGPGGANSVTNLNNWTLTKDGMVLSSGIYSVKYDLNEAYTLGLSSAPSGKYEAVVTLDGNSDTSGNQALLTGAYVLTISENVYDTSKNALDGNMDGTPGGNWVFDFTVNTNTSAAASVPIIVTPPGGPTTTQTDQLVNSTTAGTQTSPVVATDSLGEYVVIWVTDTTANGTDIVGQRYDKYGTKVGAQFTVCSYTTGDQVLPDVAMDSVGDFVVVWAGVGTDDTSGVYARIYNYAGTAMSTQFRVNQYTTSDQTYPTVAMDDNGDFVVTWTSSGQDGSGGGIYARRFNKLGTALGNEFLVNTTTTYWQEKSDVAMDSNGNFVIVWESDQQDGSSWGIYGQRYNSSGTRLGGEFGINTYTTDKQVTPQVAMDSAGDFFVVWSSFGEDGSGYGVYARRYSSAGAALDSKEFRVNQTTSNWQYQPSVSADDAGMFVVTWTTYGQDNDQAQDYGIYARIFNADGSNYVDSSGVTVGEFRINNIVAGNQVSSQVAMDSDGDFIVVWVGPDADSTGIYSRIVAINLASYATTTGNSAAVSTGLFGIGLTDSSDSTTGTPTFTMLTPTTGTYVTGQTITITWTASNVVAGSVISLCLDTDTTLWNGNEKWIEVDKVSASSGTNSYTYTLSGVSVGTYYVGGYLYDPTAKTFMNSHLIKAITVPAPTFNLTGPTSGTYVPGDSVNITWTAANVSSNDAITLCLDKDTTMWNGNEKWIEVDKVSASTGSYTFTMPNVAAGTYYVAGYMYDKATYAFTYSYLTSTITVPAPTFTLTGPASGTYVPGDSVTITWTAANVSSNDVVTLCLDTDTTMWNGNEKWIEVDKVAASAGTYTFTMPNIGAGSYYVAGYMYDKATYAFTYSYLTSTITVPATTFNLTGPTSGTYVPGDSVNITWTAANVSSNDVITLCLDKDTTMWNGNEKWIEVDKVSASTGSYTFTMPNVAADTYYIGGYMYDKATQLFTYSYLLQSITIAANSSQSQSAALSTLTSNVGGSIGAPAAQGGTDGASLVDNTSNLVVMTKDLVFSSGIITPSSFSQRLTGASGANNQEEEELFASTNRKEEQSAVDAALQDQDIWLEKASADWLA